MELKEIEMIPGLYKIFDEILVNAADNYWRSGKTKMIKVKIDEYEGTVSIFNDGPGIPVAIHKK